MTDNRALILGAYDYGGAGVRVGAKELPFYGKPCQAIDPVSVVYRMRHFNTRAREAMAKHLRR